MLIFASRQSNLRYDDFIFPNFHLASSAQSECTYGVVDFVYV